MNGQSYAERARRHQGGAERTSAGARDKREKREKVRLPESLAVIAQRERWDLDATVAYILALSDEKRAVYRAALAFDTEALKRADAMLAATDGQSGIVGRPDA